MDRSAMRNLLEPLPGDDLAGPCLEYTPEFLELVDAGLTHEEQQYGNVVAQARGVDGQKLVRLSSELAEHTRDLRVAIALTDGLCRTEGWSGLATGLEIVAQWTIAQWDSVHPQLEAEDEYDPTARINILAFLTDDLGLFRSVRDLRVAEHRTLGVLTLSSCRELWMHEADESGEYVSHSVTLTGKTNIDVIRSSRLAHWFEGASQDWIANRVSEIDRAIVALNRITQFVNQLSGMVTLDQKRLSDLLRMAKEIYSERLSAVSSLPIPNMITPSASSTSSIALSETDLNATNVSVTNDLTSGLATTPTPIKSTQCTAAVDTNEQSIPIDTLTIRSRAQAVEALDAICVYFTKHEPASPVPMLIQRAKRLVPMSFAEILRELSSGSGPSILQQLMGCEELST